MGPIKPNSDGCEPLEEVGVPGENPVHVREEH